jgi:hypothetical protein
MIEHLESRTLMSVVSADASAIAADANTIESAFFSLKATATADVKTLLADIKRSKGTAAAKGFVNALKSHANSDLNIVENKGKSIETAVGKAVVALDKDFAKLQANPTKASLEAKVSSDIKKLNAAAAGKQVVFTSDIQTVYTTAHSELTQLAAQTTDSQTQEDIDNAQSNLLTAATSMQGNVPPFFTAISQMATDAAA